MSTTTPELTRTCARCSSQLAPGALQCDQCHTLVYANDLDKMTSRARAREGNGDLPGAREEWLSCLRILPPESQQAQWIRSHARELEATIDSVHGHKTAGKWAKRLAPLGPLAVLLAKGKTIWAFLFKAKSLFSLLAFLGVYWAAFGWKFGVGFAVQILVHEMGHYIDVKRRGLPADMPVFLPGLGAYVRWQAMGVSLETRAAVSLAGPLAGLIAAATCAIIWRATGVGVWGALARAGAWLNVLNLIPVWVLDGGHAALALRRAERAIVLLAAVGLWALFGEKIFLAVAAGAAYRLFTRDVPPESSVRTLLYFVAVIAGLALVLWVVPGQGFGQR